MGIGVAAVLIIVIAVYFISKNQSRLEKQKASQARHYPCVKKDGTPGVHTVYNWELQERWEDYPACNYDISHTYCKIAFDASGRTYYYRTRNPELKVGDRVYAPVGYKYEKKIGRIVEMKTYPGRRVPFPLERTRHLCGKAE